MFGELGGFGLGLATGFCRAGSSDIPQQFRHLPLTARDERLGAFPNWYLALAEMVMREPWAEAYLLVQDDAVLARNVREFLERELWPSPNVRAVSIYCPSHYACVAADQDFMS